MRRRYNIDLEVYASLKKKTRVLIWYLNIVLFLVSLFLVDYYVLPTQATRDVVEHVKKGNPNFRFKTKKGFKFLVDLIYFKVGDEVELTYTPIYRMVKYINSNKYGYKNENGSLRIIHFFLFLLFLPARFFVGRQKVLKAYDFLMVAASSLLIGLLDLLFLLT